VVYAPKTKENSWRNWIIDSTRGNQLGRRSSSMEDKNLLYAGAFAASAGTPSGWLCGKVGICTHSPVLSIHKQLVCTTAPPGFPTCPARFSPAARQPGREMRLWIPEQKSRGASASTAVGSHKRLKFFIKTCAAKWASG